MFVFIIVGTLVLFYNLYSFYRFTSKIKSGQYVVTTGLITGNELAHGGKSSKYYLIYEFTTENGITIAGKSHHQSSYIKHGSQTIVYNPLKPQDNEIYDDHYSPGIAFGLFLIGLGVYSLFFM